MTTSEPEPTDTAQFARVVGGNYDIVVALFCGLLLISNIGATKLISLGPLVFDGGAVLFPLTYILGDVLAEVYGLKRARRAIVLGFTLSVLASVSFLIVNAAPPGPDWDNQDAWNAVLGFVPRIVLASLLGYLGGQFVNAYVLVKIKERTREGKLWARLIGSTVLGELVDTVIFCTVAFGGTISVATWANYTITGYVYKVGVEVILLPVTYAVIRMVKRHEPSYPSPPNDKVSAPA